MNELKRLKNGTTEMWSHFKSSALLKKIKKMYRQILKTVPSPENCIGSYVNMNIMCVFY